MPHSLCYYPKLHSLFFFECISLLKFFWSLRRKQSYICVFNLSYLNRSIQHGQSLKTKFSSEKKLSSQNVHYTVYVNIYIQFNWYICSVQLIHMSIQYIYLIQVIYSIICVCIYRYFFYIYIRTGWVYTRIIRTFSSKNGVEDAWGEEQKELQCLLQSPVSLFKNSWVKKLYFN